MARLKKVKTKQDFKDGVLALMKAHNLVIPELEEDKLAESMLTYFNGYFNPPKETVKHWDIIVGIYFRIYQELNGRKPAFKALEPKALREISQVLLERWMGNSKDEVWDETTCASRHENFYAMMLTLFSVKQNFCISFIYNNLDKFISQLRAAKK